ncbi:MAG: hypothetical protein MJA83_10200 [Gammaproteobacteria bacterium]|nr:hypothetical protein [Gammaproteobacteria bacterium]
MTDMKRKAALSGLQKFFKVSLGIILRGGNNDAPYWRSVIFKFHQALDYAIITMALKIHLYANNLSAALNERFTAKRCVKKPNRVAFLDKNIHSFLQIVKEQVRVFALNYKYSNHDFVNFAKQRFMELQPA